MSTPTQTSLDRPIVTFKDRKFLILQESTFIKDATRKMQKDNIDEIIVSNSQNVPIGIVTDEDILKKIGEESANPNRATLGDIMRFPLITINENRTLNDALELMKKNHIRKVITLSDTGDITGIIRHHTIALIIKSSLNESQKENSATKAIFGNLGIIIQFSGALLLVPAFLAIFLQDTQAATSIFLMVILMLGSGFVLNSYGEKQQLGIRHMAILIASSFSLLVAFGMVPYIYLNPYHTTDLADLIASSFFSSSASFTTAGLSLFPNPEVLPQSITFFRSFCQFIGGLSFIYLIMTAFYSDTKLKLLSGFVSGSSPKFKELFYSITIIFSIYAVIIASLLFYFGERNIIDDFSVAMSALSTGGLVPHSQMLQGLLWEEYAVIIAAMILAALPISFHYRLFLRKFSLRKINTEVVTFFSILSGAVIIYSFFTNYNFLEGAFMVVSASTTAGFQIIDLNNENQIGVIILTILMLIGGCGFSTAGGLKIFRLPYLMKIKYIFNLNRFSSVEKKQIIRASLLLILFPTIPLISAIHLYGYGHDFYQSYFESVGAITSGGLGFGLVDQSLEYQSKIIFGVLMIVGRLEIILILGIFIPRLLG